jgi:hypothetical protein
MKSLQYLFGADLINLNMPATFPGAVNPMLWWTTPNMQVVSAADLEAGLRLLNAGLETTFAIILRCAFQRSFSTLGVSCVQNVILSGTNVFKLDTDSAKYGFAFAFFQLFMSLIAFICYIPWLFSHVPIGPAIRLASEKTYLTVMLSTQTELLQGMNGNTATTEIWSKLDFPVRVGEHVSTRDDPDVGHIVMDKPKFVGPFTFAKRYI